MPMPSRVSASQHSAYSRCRRYWHFGWVKKLPRKNTAAKGRGKGIHAEVEHYLLTGEIRDSSYPEEKTKDGVTTEVMLNYRRYVEALAPLLPPPKHPELILEQEIWLTTPQGVPWTGYIDIGYHGDDVLIIRDLKTVSDLRWMKTPEELRADIQLISYARWVYEHTGYDGDISIGHIYLLAPKGRVPKQPKTALVTTTVDREHVNAVWTKELEQLDEMLLASEVDDTQELPPTITGCSMFGGCDFREQCGLGADDVLAQLRPKRRGKTDVSEWLSKLKKKKSQPQKSEILPPDAPSRTVDDDEPEASAAPEPASPPKRGRGRPKKKKPADEPVAAAVSEPAPPPAPAPVEDEPEEPEEPPAASKKVIKLPVKGKAADKKTFTLYIDCSPMKGGGDLEPTLFEDWFSSLVMGLEEAIGHSHLELDYSKEKLAVMTAIQESSDSLPPAMVVMSTSFGAKEAISHLVPFATTVIRAVRG